jgi:hypothetical protein
VRGHTQAALQAADLLEGAARQAQALKARAAGVRDARRRFRADLDRVARKLGPLLVARALFGERAPDDPPPAIVVEVEDLAREAIRDLRADTARDRGRPPPRLDWAAAAAGLAARLRASAREGEPPRDPTPDERLAAAADRICKGAAGSRRGQPTLAALVGFFVGRGSATVEEVAAHVYRRAASDGAVRKLVRRANDALAGMRVPVEFALRGGKIFREFSRK